MSFAVTPEQIRSFRSERGWSQAEFGLRVGVKKRTVEDWEAGRRSPLPMLGLALNFIRQCESLQRQLALMEEGTMRVRIGNEDVTEQQIAQARNEIVTYESLLKTMATE
ncbi:helix-turn-helix domain-containing protein [Brevundimonas diminuta]|uniref:helix-turn-helix domain-containing protein n=1 Tax=Brevundimonas diminuta TaxID=293 RepID=UPI003D9A9E7C